jgi:hypothetical protein
MSSLFEISKNKPGLSHGQMMRQATLSLLDSATTDADADPLVWAPFVVVGEPAKLQEPVAGLVPSQEDVAVPRKVVVPARRVLS